MIKVLDVGLIKSKGIQLPVKNYIFINELKNFDEINKYTNNWIENNCEINSKEKQFLGIYRINLYIKGKTIIPLLASVISACIKNEIQISLFYYNKNTKEYEKQTLL